MKAAGRRLIIFDLDGTLIDSCEDLATAVNLMRGHYHLPPLPSAVIRGYIGNGVRMLVTRALQGTGIDIDEALRVQAPFYSAHVAVKTVLYPGVEEGLAQLAERGHMMAVATNKSIEPCEAVLAHFGIRDRFFRVLAGGNFPVLKPAPDMVFDIMSAAGLTAADTWMVGDNYTDLESARRAGVSSVFLSYGYGDPGAEAPTVRCDTFNEVVRLFA